MKCPHCSTTLDDGARFCGACGRQLGASAPRRPPTDALMKTMLAAAPPARSTAPPARAVNPALAKAKPPVAVAPVAPAAPTGDPYVGQTLNNRYSIERKLGEGGFGAVYEATQTNIGRKVAVKLLHPESARDPKLVARFRREGKVACNLRDAHTVTTYDFDQTPDGTLYIAMELLTGKSLHEVFHHEAPLDWRRVLRIIEQMCSSLGEAHTQGIVHRDLKPENIYLEKRPGNSDFVKVLDFGIAKIIGGGLGGGGQSMQLTAMGQTLGTLEYMSPEQLMGKELDGRSDVYALGVLAFEMVTARLPFPDAKGPAELIGAQLRRVPDNASKACPGRGIPDGVDKVIARCLEKTKDKRYPTVDDLRNAIHAVLSSGGKAAPQAGGVQDRGPHSTEPARAKSTPPPQAGPGTVTSLTDVEESLFGKAWVWAVFLLAGAGGAAAAYFVLR